MDRTINIKGVGFVTAKSDLVEIYIKLESLHKNYSKAYKSASDKILTITAAIEALGYEKSEIKTLSFEIDSDYSSYRDENDKYVREFIGYNVKHRLKFAFDFDADKLSKVLDAIAKTEVNPEIDIKFTIKNPDSIKKDLLKSAAINVREKAEVLCQASGVILGNLLSIKYNWSEIDIFSETDYSIMRSETMLMESTVVPMDIEPEDVTLRDTADFIWEIK